MPLQQLREKSPAAQEEIVLVDVRGAEEQQVSMIPGAVTKEHFESELLPKLRAEPGKLVVPYCTVGFRSGVYAKELVEKHGLQNVRNGEGVIMWTFEGSGLVRQSHPTPPASVLGREEEPALAWQAVREVHVFGKPWDMAAEGYSTVYFSNVGGALRFGKQKCSTSGPRALPWVTIFLLFYLFFTPACGVMYDCGCRLALSKFSQVQTCNIYWPGHLPQHKCPWCSCSGFSCIFVASDSKAFRGVPLLDLLPDGFFVTLITVAVLVFAFKRTDKCLQQRGSVAIAMAKTAIAVTWFLSYCIVFGALFFAGSAEYPYFLGFSRV
ncbi:unnamed protein product [Effrenium voratum]|nr:unnamed protein product [Effrenium voratum]